MAEAHLHPSSLGGNQQISSNVVRMVGRENMIVIATKHKLGGLKGLRVDTGDLELDDELR